MSAAKTLHAAITEEIVAILRTTDPNTFELPWTRPGLTTPKNAVTHKAYNGINILGLWASSLRRGYSSGLFATYRQWRQLGAQVRRGEKASTVVFYKNVDRTETSDTEAAPPSEASRGDGPRLIARASAVFAAEQVDGFELPGPANVASPSATGADHLAAVAAFIKATGAHIVEGGERAFYRPSTDTIHIPPPSAFVGTQTLSPTEGYFGTALHELAHWTAHPSRLHRDLSHRFGSEGYGMEELVAELAAAFLCVELGVSPSPRPDHAQYLKNWLQVLQNDERAIFTAASKASQAAAYLQSLQPGDKAPDPNAPDPFRERTVSTSSGPRALSLASALE